MATHSSAPCRRLRVGFWGVGLTLLVACQVEAVDERPERLVEAFVERMASVHGDPARGKAAVALLWRKGRQNLEERAERASAAAGRKVEPEEMLVPSRFAMNFTPKSYVAQVEGEYARVFLKGDSPADVAEVHCVLEDGRWRVVLRLPELPMIQKRGE